MGGPILFGLETEYGFTPLGPDGSLLDRTEIAAELMAEARARVPHLPDVASLGIFLANGSRLYVDRGIHPEVSTPECSDPGELVAYVRAGERVLAEAARAVERGRPGSRILLFACNVEYGGTGETWGCHESYLHRGSNVRMGRSIIPHLVSRIVYTGGGGFDNRRRGLRFLISPRACQIRGPEWGERWFVSKRVEPLCVGSWRLHVISGESQRSPIGLWLGVGTTALVVWMMDAGVYDGADLELAHPIAAMRAIATDPTCRRRVKLEDGRELDAIGIQEHYLRRAEENVGRDFMPAWAGRVCREWRAMLERLREAPGSVATTLDWAIKHAIYTRRGHSTPELQEIDTRFAELGELGIHGKLLRAGVLSDGVDGILPIARALESPPPVGRAAKRGELVRELSGRDDRYLCDWEGVIDCDEGVFADLRDPYASEIRWRPIEEGSREWREDGLVEEVRKWTNASHGPMGSGPRAGPRPRPARSDSVRS